jgi:hypothetical protein
MIKLGSEKRSGSLRARALKGKLIALPKSLREIDSKLTTDDWPLATEDKYTIFLIRGGVYLFSVATHQWSVVSGAYPGRAKLFN